MDADEFKADLRALYLSSEKARKHGHGTVTGKQADQIKKSIEEFVRSGAQTVDSCRVYISALAGIISDLAIDFPPESKKHAYINDVLEKIGRCFEYCEDEFDGAKHDYDGMELNEVFSKLFKESM